MKWNLFIVSKQSKENEAVSGMSGDAGNHAC